MVINYNANLAQALEKIKSIASQEFVVHEHHTERGLHNTDEILELHGEVTWKIVDLLNEKYNQEFCLSHWLNKKDDEVAHFINEAGSNALAHSEFKAPYKFHLFFGETGFIIGVEQKGKGFNPKTVDAERIKTSEGAAFNFFRTCNSSIFFDNHKDAKIVYMEYLF